MNFILDNKIDITSSTPDEFDHSVGYHDVKPFNIKNDDQLILHRYPQNTIGPKKNLLIDICLWDHKKKLINKIDETTAWSWEQGSRLQWLDENRIIYNKQIDNRFVSCVYNKCNKEKVIFNNPFYSIKNNNFLTLNYSRLWTQWKNYGYFSSSGIQNNSIDIEYEGIFLCDFNGNKNLILSIKNAIKLCGLENINKTFFLAHPTFNPSGNKFVSILRFFNDSGTLISFFICTDLGTLENKLLAREKVSHFEWLDDNRLVVWCRKSSKKIELLRFNKFTEKYLISNVKKIINYLNPSLKQKITSTHYYVLDLNNDNKAQILDKNILTEDGHPQISTNNNFLITDTYANKKGFQKLLFYEIKKDKTHVIGEFKVDDKLISQNLKYDLHPRWNFKDNLISIDSSHEGSRQSYILNLEKYIKQF